MKPTQPKLSTLENGLKTDLKTLQIPKAAKNIVREQILGDTLSQRIKATKLKIDFIESLHKKAPLKRSSHRVTGPSSFNLPSIDRHAGSDHSREPVEAEEAKSRVREAK